MCRPVASGWNCRVTVTVRGSMAIARTWF
jgi:hypothetical protein